MKGKENRESAMLFIDGSNWYHALKKIGVDSTRLDYWQFAERLVRERDVRAIRYYVGKAIGDRMRIAKQAAFVERLQSQNVQSFFGRIERNFMTPERNPLTKEIKALLANPPQEIPREVCEHLDKLCRQKIPYYTEKQVDVHIAVDLVKFAHQDQYDVAYLLSADGDFVPAVDEARGQGKKVFAASTLPGKHIGDAVNTFIPLKRADFDGVQGETF